MKAITVTVVVTIVPRILGIIIPLEFNHRNSVFSGSYKFSSTFGAPLWESNFTSNPYYSRLNALNAHSANVGHLYRAEQKHLLNF